MKPDNEKVYVLPYKLEVLWLLYSLGIKEAEAVHFKSSMNCERVELSYKVAGAKVYKTKYPGMSVLWIYNDVVILCEGSSIQMNPDSTSLFSSLGASTLIKEIDLHGVDTSHVISMERLFYGCERLERVNLGDFNTSSAFNMEYMFSHCKSLKWLDLRNFDTSHLVTASGMFCDCGSLSSVDLSGLDTCNVRNTSFMFLNCKRLKSIKLTGDHFDNLADAKKMFYGCKNLKEVQSDDDRILRTMHLATYDGCDELVFPEHVFGYPEKCARNWGLCNE